MDGTEIKVESVACYQTWALNSEYSVVADKRNTTTDVMYAHKSAVT